MLDLNKHINDSCSEYKNHEIAVACSGGLDSMVLLYLLHANQFNVRAIHVNYQLRGKESDLDEAFVSTFCAKNKIPFESRKVDLSQLLKEGGNLQELAREIRYQWFHEITDSTENRFVFLGHHLNDQVETFFLNIARNSGIMGLACMPFERDNLVRPFLKITKQELMNYAHLNQLKWREDASNATSKYRRNRLRNEIIPSLEIDIPELTKSIDFMIDIFQKNQLEIADKIRPIKEEICLNESIQASIIESLNEFEIIELFRQLDQPYHRAKACSELFHAQKGKFIELDQTANNPFTFIYKESNSYSFVTQSKANETPKFHVEEINTLPKSFTKNELFLDYSKVYGSLQLRRWKIGDRMKPIGMNGSQLISDIISDAKLDFQAKKHVLVLHDDKQIHWCVGLKIGKSALANSKSEQILKITIAQE